MVILWNKWKYTSFEHDVWLVNVNYAVEMITVKIRNAVLL